MKLLKASRLANGLQKECKVDILQNEVKQSDSSATRLLPVSFSRIGTTKAFGVTLQSREGLRRNTWRQYLITRSTFVRLQKLLFRLAATTKTASGWSGKWGSQRNVLSKMQGQEAILYFGRCNETTANT